LQVILQRGSGSDSSFRGQMASKEEEENGINKGKMDHSRLKNEGEEGGKESISLPFLGGGGGGFLWLGKKLWNRRVAAAAAANATPATRAKATTTLIARNDEKNILANFLFSFFHALKEEK
jgi:hypothetical protein